MRKLMRAVAGAGLMALLSQAASLAQADEFENIVLSAEEGAAESVDTFTTDTPKIYVGADLDEVSSGSKITVAWISVDSGGAAPPNYKIDEASFDVGAIENHINASLSRPNNGWPVGTYQVQLAVDGEVVESVDFSVE